MSAGAALMSAEVPLADPGRPDDAAAGALLDQPFDAQTLHLLRAAVLAHAAAAGMPQHRATDVMLAVHELAANAVRHGAGAGWLRMQAGSGAMRAQVSDAGPANLNGHTGTGDQEAGGADWWPRQPGHGLWLVRQVTDQMSVLCGQGGSLVTAVFNLPAAEGSPAAADGPGYRPPIEPRKLGQRAAEDAAEAAQRKLSSGLEPKTE
jgi:anti-sigma regulatory factor (Ser/Thr protein kinase)